MPECDYCGNEFKNEGRLRTHKLIEHREELTAEDAEIDISDGHLKEKEVEKGEQFGYR